MDFAKFQRENWERKPLLVQRADRDYFSELMTIADYDSSLNLAGDNLEHLRVVQDGKETPVSELGSGSSHTALEAVYARYRTGATIVMNSIQDRFPSMNRLMRSLGSEIGARIQVNSYLTPANARGFAPHYDMHDVFIVQVHGTKRWQLFDSQLPLPLRTQPYDRAQPDPALVSEFELKAGDLLYLPRGTVHAATSTDEASLHLTVGVHPILWANVLYEAIQNVVETDARFRAGLPMGFTGSEEIQQQVRDTLTELVADLPSKIAVDDAVATAVTRGVSMNAPALRGHLLDLERLDEITAGTKVQRRLPIQWDVTVDEQTVLGFHGKTVRFPAHVADEVRFTAQRSSGVFTAATIPGELDEAGRLVLVRTLVNEGFLTFA
ncbi:cupin domain-containing protein [Kitasatospora sp. GP82]|uniref:cupin domain-containing protein n=1 Tax=Kitasatospora sp. GP82 TaxID=3035089 RepID=UPI002474622C|nr:cupin domain-containing protein [Kitasatospora sp. GP82]